MKSVYISSCEERVSRNALSPIYSRAHNGRIRVQIELVREPSVDPVTTLMEHTDSHIT
jgi:hypothetical protein